MRDNANEQMIARVMQRARQPGFDPRAHLRVVILEHHDAIVTLLAQGATFHMIWKDLSEHSGLQVTYSGFIRA